MTIEIRIIETPAALKAVEDLQRLIWSGNETEVVPIHIFRAAVHNGGLVIGAYQAEQLVGFVFGFPGIDFRSGQRQLIHASHMAGVHPEFRDSGLGFKLKRAQWQMVRKQGIERICWTYDPLQSRNANLNIAKLGAVCKTYIPNYYGEMRDGINKGMPSDRFQVDWWVNSNRVRNRLGKSGDRKLGLANYLDAGVPIVNRSKLNTAGLPEPATVMNLTESLPLLVVEIPSNIQVLKSTAPDIAVSWSDHLRKLFLHLFENGYYVTDFVYLPGSNPRSFYILTQGFATL
jgi:predicted GNAT superfamily acetyltransferase